MRNWVIAAVVVTISGSTWLCAPMSSTVPEEDVISDPILEEPVIQDESVPPPADAPCEGDACSE